MDAHAKTIHVYRNGDRFWQGSRVIVTPRKFRTFDSLLAELTLVTKPPSGAVRRLFTPKTGSRITSLDQVHDGEFYVAAPQERFRRLKYKQIENKKWALFAKSPDKSNQGAGFRSSRFRGGHEPMTDGALNSSILSAPKVITVFRNGDPFHTGAKVLLNKKTCQSFEQVMQDITDMVKLGCAVRRLYTLDGERIQTLPQLVGEERIVASGPESYKRTIYGGVHLPRRFSSKKKERNDVRRALEPIFAAASEAEEEDEDYFYGEEEKLCGQADKLLAQHEMASNHVAQEKKRQENTRKSKLAERKRRRDKHRRKASEIQEESDRLSSHIKKEKTRQMSRMQRKVTQRRGGAGGKKGKQSPEPETASDPIQQKYDIGEVIGTGNFAVVRLCTNKATGKQYALKIIDKAKSRMAKEDMLGNELKILKLCSHPNIIGLVEEHDTEDELFLVMELVQGGDLFDRIVARQSYTEVDAATLLKDMAKAVTYMHRQNIVHRDLKPENLLVFTDGDDIAESIKIGDFGLAKSLETTPYLFTVCGTPTYIAPEILAGNGYGLEVDIWAMGVILFVMLSGYAPFQEDNQEKLFKLIEQGEFEFESPWWDDISPSAKDLISKMLCVSVKDRYTAEDVLSHPWTQQLTTSTKDLKRQVSLNIKRNFNPKNKFRGAMHALSALAQFQGGFKGPGGAVLRDAIASLRQGGAEESEGAAGEASAAAAGEGNGDGTFVAESDGEGKVAGKGKDAADVKAAAAASDIELAAWKIAQGQGEKVL